LQVIDVLSLNNSVDRIYPIENEIKDTTERDRSGSYLDLHLEIDNEGRLSTKLYDKRDDNNFPIVNFPFMRSTISAAHAHGTPLEVAASYIYILFHEIKWNFPTNVTLSIHKQFLAISRTHQNSRSKLRTCKGLDVFLITYLH
jgi:hypothetical protein